ncbi:arylamine N-acetyltransferase 1 [Meredithblackwellia eburnea MCA 4105]
MATYPQNPFSTSALTRDEAAAYLDRIKLPHSLLDSPASLELLAQLFLAQLENIPKDTSPLHAPSVQWDGPSSPIVLGSSFTGMPVGLNSQDRIVKQGKGAFCFSINATLAAFLRYWKFRVSEMVTRCYKQLGEDPTTHPLGWHWGTMTHEVLIVDWEGSDGRYLVDGAWGPWNQTAPIKLEHNNVVPGLNSYEAFQLRNEELPLSPWMPRPIDNIKGWTFSRYITPVGTKIQFPITEETPGYWTPLFHFLPISVPVLDFTLYHHFSASHELASFTAFWLVTKLIPNSGGARRSMMYAEKEGMPRRAKIYTTGGEESQGSQEGRDVVWVDMETGPMLEILRKDFCYPPGAPIPLAIAPSK